MGTDTYRMYIIYGKGRHTRPWYAHNTRMTAYTCTFWQNLTSVIEKPSFMASSGLVLKEGCLTTLASRWMAV